VQEDRLIKMKFENYRMMVFGELRKIPVVELYMHTKDGKWCMSFEEYNRIVGEVNEIIRRRRNVRYK